MGDPTILGNLYKTLIQLVFLQGSVADVYHVFNMNSKNGDPWQFI